MKILLDECIPRGFKSTLCDDESECVTVPEAGLAGKRNGELLMLAESSFDVFVTLDKGIAHQQNLKGRKIAVVLIRCNSNRLADLRPHAQACHEAIAKIRPGEILRVGEE